MSDRLLFLTFCWGAAGTTWLARLLNAHQDIFCMHAPMLPRFDHLQLTESTEIVDRVFTDHSFGGSYPIVGFTHGIAPEWYETLTDKYGVQLRCLALTRHPIRRIQSTFNLHVGLQDRLASDPTWRRAFGEVHGHLTRRSGRAFPDDFESLAFYHACSMVNSITWEQQRPFPLYRLEDVVAREDVVQELVGHVSDGTRQLPTSVIQAMQRTVVHSHSWRRLSPSDVYAAWRPEHREAYHLLVAGEAIDGYRRLGYELPEPPRPFSLAGALPLLGRLIRRRGEHGSPTPWAEGPADPGGPSPLIRRALGAPVPGLVRLDRMSPWNGATVVAGSPLVATLPRQRWAYGLLFALDHSALGTSRDRPVAAAVELGVEGGEVGVMGIARGFERATTAESVVGPGRATVCLLLDPSRQTSAIALRTVGETDEPPRVRVTRIEAFELGEARLARRRHDLGFDLFVVLAPRAVVTEAIERTIAASADGVQVRRLHRLTADASHASEPPAVGGEPEIDPVRAVRSEIAAVAGAGGRVAFVAAMREPIDLAICTLFASLTSAVPVFGQLHAIGGQFVELLAAGLIDHLRAASRRTPESPAAPADPLWGATLTPGRYCAEFLEVTGVDLLSHPIDPAAGFTVVDRGNQAVLVLRHEDMPGAFSAGLAALTGRKGVTLDEASASDASPCDALEADFRQRFRIPADLAEALYDRDPHVRHFYSEAEIATFKARWGA